MKVTVFLPKYMIDFKCISTKCTDTCCAGWNINIDEKTFQKYEEAEGTIKDLLNAKYKKSSSEDNYMEHGLMVLKEGKKCPFLDDDMLCSLQKNAGEGHLCITCRNYPRVFNIIDDIYEKSGIPSCEEICRTAFLKKEKMEFVEVEEEIDEDRIEIRRIVESESDELIGWFWEIRILSINIMQNRDYTIEERLVILKNVYAHIAELFSHEKYDEIQEFFDDCEEDNLDYEKFNTSKIDLEKEFCHKIKEEKLLNNIKGERLKKCLSDYMIGLENDEEINDVLSCKSRYIKELDDCAYVLENYFVNMIFKDLIPFNRGNDIVKSADRMINIYKIIYAYAVGCAIKDKAEINEERILRIIQALSKDIEHNRVFEDYL